MKCLKFSSSQCDPVTGVFLTCADGLNGIKCGQSCYENTWGSACANKCNCAFGHHCNNIDGTCECNIGFTGKFCEKRKFFFILFENIFYFKVINFRMSSEYMGF